MASITTSDPDRHDQLPTMTAQLREPITPWGLIKLILTPVASLRVTVALFAMLLFVVFVGTLAQVEDSMWEAVHRYFYSVFVWVEFRTLSFLPRMLFPSIDVPEGWGFPFLGAGAIGVLLAVNLLAAHVVRFTIQARGLRLAIGLLITALGVGLTTFVVVSGQNSDGLQGVPSFVTAAGSWQPMWLGMKFGVLPLLIVIAIVSAVGLMFSGRRTVEAVLAGIIALLLFALGVLLWMIIPEFALDDSALRILWQLTQGGLAAIVLMVGCLLAFKQRGGIVVLHAGVGLLIVGMFYVAYFAVEEQMTIEEGKSTNEAHDIRHVEFAILDRSPEKLDDVVAIPSSRLVHDERVSNAKLPFDVQLVEYMPNSARKPLTLGERTPATHGAGKYVKAVPRPVGAGAEAGGDVDLAAAYVQFLEKESGDDLGTYLVSQASDPQKVNVGGKSFDVELRFKTTPKPYTIELIDVRKDDYMGTDTPMNYSSLIRLRDSRSNEDRKVKIWMNNPLRYAGETFYQTSYFPAVGGRAEITTLSVVTNTGWMMPYVACMVVGVGMLVHFWIVLVRFLKRLVAGERQREAAAVVDAEIVPGAAVRPAHRPAKRRKDPRRPPLPVEKPGLALAGILGPGIAAVIVLGCFAYAAKPPGYSKTQMDLYAAGKIPVMYQGRIKPLDTLARNSLLIVSDREYFYDEKGRQQPAIRWLLDLAAGNPAAAKYEVFRIDNHEVLDIFGLDRRKGFRYSVDEILTGIKEFEKQVAKAAAVQRENPQQLTTVQSKLLEVRQRIHAYMLIMHAFRPPQLPDLNFTEDHDRAEVFATIMAFREQRAKAEQEIMSQNPPLAVPGNDGEAWRPLSLALVDASVARAVGQEPDAQTLALGRIVAAYHNNDVIRFNADVKAYGDLLQKDPPKQLMMPVGWFERYFRPVTDFEAYFNSVAPFTWCTWLYAFAGVVAFVGFLAAIPGWMRPFRRAALTIIILTFLLHTAALAARMYISGRPPVTNLYSSAVFIGWFCVLGCIVLEFISRIGVGNLLAFAIGMTTMMIADRLAGDGDTMAVLQAVLDTQFWLATHVVTITAGYSTTFIAGALALATIPVIIALRLFMPDEGRDVVRILYKMTYGAVCFAILFSFIGTVLGGLWADDSWGRFWGWDPKENGAAMIVIWNAIVLHARWGRMVAERGFAVLAVFGNIVTAWSWFGVNELGVGLHSYGFTDGVVFWLFLFVLSQFFAMGVGLIPMRFWQWLRNALSGNGTAQAG